MTKLSATAAPAEPPKTTWEKIIASTPVVLTVIATILAGISSSEMTQAQYHRTLAAQNQSKAGDQWNFFQAKRIRQSEMENTKDLLHGMSGSTAFDPAMTQAFAERVSLEVSRSSAEAGMLAEAVASGTDSLGSAAGPISMASERFRASVAAASREAESLRSATAPVVGDPQVRQSLAYAAEGKLPEVTDKPIEPPSLGEAVAAIGARQPEERIAPLVANVQEKQVQAALVSADANAAAFDCAAKPAGQALDRVREIIDRETGIAQTLVRSARALSDAIRDLPGDSGPAHQAREAGDRVLASAGSLKADADALFADFTAARLRFTILRYEREGQYNQQVALLYEVQVRKSSIQADRHRLRSQRFFYGMLFAQAAVTISTLALAMKQKSVLWAVATVAGMAAIAFSAYVYLST